ncbi:17303_t:CDS:2 [Cetraspora pellucida]|uniref:17303_t:CDS:1 n=1 Tax=Cetraspora pellucida TaxID=1433469 RepID=A0ACA9N9A0_9GLOM|nr:17303_t:CDS:2 [Cetraspora pellucida]
MSNQLTQPDTCSVEQNKTLKRKSVGRPREKIWDYYITSNVVGDHSATCHYCSKYWSCGRPGEMEAHLANICPDVPIDIKTYWQESLSTKIVNYKRMKINETVISDIDEFLLYSNQELLSPNTQELSPTNIQKLSSLNIQEFLPSNLQGLSLSNDQEIASPEVIEQTDTLTISEVIDITNLSIETDDQLKVNRSHGSNIKNSNSVNYSTDDLITRMFEANSELELQLN